MQMKKIFATLGLCFTLIVSSGESVIAEVKPFEKTAAGKASKELIKQFTTFVKDVTEMQGMTDEQQVNYILTKGKERIWKETTKKTKEAIKAKILDYVKVRARADLFKAKVPEMMHQAIVGRETVSAVWSKADIDIKSKLDTHMNALKSAITVAEVGWDVYSTWSEKGADQALQKLGTTVGDKLMEYMIPGWGYYRLAQAAVQAIGEYVVGYAFDTAFQGKMEIILGGMDPKKNPQAFKDWILNADIRGYVQREWDEQLAYGGWYLKGKNNEGDKMKDAIISELERLKADVQAKTQIESQIRSNIEALDQQVRAAAGGVSAIADQAGKEAEPALAVIDDFRSKIYGAQKADATEAVAEIKNENELIFKWIDGQPQAYPYPGFDRGTIVSALAAGLDEVKDFGIGGYDMDRVNQGLEAYAEIRKKILGDTSKKIADNIAQSTKQLEALETSYRPQLDSISIQASNLPYEERYDATRRSLWAQYDSISRSWSNAARPYWNSSSDWLQYTKYNEDLEILAAEEKVVILEAKERAMRRVVELERTRDLLQPKMDDAVQSFSSRLAEVDSDAKSALAYPDGWCSAYYYKSIATNLNIGSELTYYYIGDVLVEMTTLEEMKKNFTADRNTLSGFYNKRKQFFSDYMIAALNAKNGVQAAVPKALMETNQADGSQWSETDASFGVKRFYIAALDLGAQETIPNMGIVMIPRIWGGQRTLEEAEKAAGGADELAELDRTITAVDKKIQEIRPLMEADEVASIFMRIQRDVAEDPVMLRVPDITLQEEKARQDDMYIMPDNAAFMGYLPEKMKGYEYMKILADAWERHKETIQKMNNLKKGIGNAVRYQVDFKENAYRVLDRWNEIPARIALYQETYETVKKVYDERLGYAEKYLKEGQEKLAEIDKAASGKKEALKLLEKMKKEEIQNNLQLYKVWSTWGKNDRLDAIIKGWNEIDTKVTDDIKRLKEEIDREEKAKTDEWRRLEEERKRREEEARKKAEEDAAKKKEDDERQWQRSSYMIENARLNTISLKTVMGQEVILMRSDLRAGAIDITFRLPTIDKIRTLLISEDSGRTWKELALTQNISYSFVPMPDRQYQPMIRIKTELEDMQQEIFPGIPAIIFRDIDYNQLIAETIKKMADSYEQKNMNSFSDCISRDFLGNKIFLEEGVRFDFDMFTDIRLTIFINKIEKRGNSFAADTKWDKSQTPRTTGQQQRTSGNTTMLFVLEDGTMRIKNLKGNLIYATLSPEIAQSSGLSQTVVDEVRTAHDERNPIQPGAGETENSGGVSTSNIETGSFTLTQAASHAPLGCQGYTFAARQIATEDALDISSDFRRREGFAETRSGNGIQDLGAVGINSVTEAPASGYVAGGFGAIFPTPVDGHTYAIQISDGTYALVELSNMVSGMWPNSTQVTYKYQRSGTRSFTQ